MTVMTLPGYTLAERDRRWNLARTFMDQHGVDALICYGEHEDSGPAPYNYDSWFTNDRPGYTVLFPRTGKPLVFALLPACIVDNVHATNGGEITWISAENFRVGRDAGSLNTAIKELGLVKSTIGVLGLEPFIPVQPNGIMPFSLWSQVLSENPDAIFKSIGEAFGRMILRLGDEEVAVLRHAASIGDSIAQAMVRAAGVGVSESEIYRAGMDAAHRRGTAVPMIHLYSGPAAINWGPPKWTYSPQAPPRILQSGDVLTSEIFSNFGGRSTQLQVTIAIGEVHEDVNRAAKIARACYEAGLKALRPKVRFGDVAEAMRKPLEEAGGWSKGPQIHSLNPILAICKCELDLNHVGASQQYPLIWQLPTLAPDLILEPGMSFAFEPCCLFGSHGATIGGTVVVGEDEPIELNPYPARMLRVH